MAQKEAMHHALNVPLTFCVSPVKRFFVRVPDLFANRRLRANTARDSYKKPPSRGLSIHCQKTQESESASSQVPSRGRKLAVVGLGNPGKNYTGTRHNIGFDVVDALAAVHRVSFTMNRSLEAEIARLTLAERDVLLVRPRTYMNSSGRTVRKLKLPTRALLIVADDIALNVGRVKLKSRGSAGGHNGLKSIESAIGGREYARMRIGVGEAGAPDRWRDHVLGRFNRAERAELDEIIIDCCNVIEEWIKHDDLQRPIDMLSRIIGSKRNVKS